MNGIIITEKNFNMIASKVIKFFNGADVIQWHSFNCGMKRHIPTDFIMKIGNDNERKRVKCVYRYPCTSAEVCIGIISNEPFIRINLIEGSACALGLGDVIKFCGNRVQLRTKFIGSDFQWLYETYQLWDKNGGFKDIKPEHGDYFYDEMWDYE